MSDPIGTTENQVRAELHGRLRQIRRAGQRLAFMRRDHENMYMAPEVYREQMASAIVDLESILSRGMTPQKEEE